MEKIPVKLIKTRIKLKDKTLINGYININGYDRPSDYIKNEKEKYIVVIDPEISGQKNDVVIINKFDISYCIPFE